MSSRKILNDRERIKVAASKGQLKDVIKLSTKFSDDVKLLSETLIESCCDGHLDVVKWMVEHTAADVNYTGVIRRTRGEEVDLYYTPLTAACTYCREIYFIVYKSLILYTVYIYVGIENILFPCNPELVDLLDI